MWWLRSLLYTTPWSRFGPVALTALWLLFLPNSFYLVTDLIHLEPSTSISYLYDMVMLTSFVLTGVIVGMMSIYLMHMALRRRLGPRGVYITLGAVFLLSSLGIYFGRFLGWNSWDIVVNPVGLLLDVGDRLVYPTQHQNTYTTTLLFFVFISGAYSSFYWSVKSLKSAR